KPLALLAGVAQRRQGEVDANAWSAGAARINRRAGTQAAADIQEVAAGDSGDRDVVGLPDFSLERPALEDAGEQPVAWLPEPAAVEPPAELPLEVLASVWVLGHEGPGAHCGAARCSRRQRFATERRRRSSVRPAAFPFFFKLVATPATRSSLAVGRRPNA